MKDVGGWTRNGCAIAKRRLQNIQGIDVELESDTGGFFEAHEKRIDLGRKQTVFRDLEHDMPAEMAAQFIERKRCGADNLNAFALRFGTRSSFLGIC